MRTIWLALLFLALGLEKASGYAVNQTGSDLSGSLEGAGGLASQALQYRPPNELLRFAKCSGGLLARSTGYGSGSVNYYYHADAIGNITAMVDSALLLSASYRYDSYGKPHFHLEQQTPSGKWKDAGPDHRCYFKEDGK